jgi:DNA polymerase-3 subunit alpha
MLWSEDYARYSNYLEKGKNVFITGGFRQRFNKAEFEFRIEKMMLLESIKPILTKQVVMDVEARYISPEMVQFMETNVKKYPGKTGLKFNIVESKTQARVSLFSMGTGFEMNDELSAFLEKTPELEVQVVTV